MMWKSLLLFCLVAAAAASEHGWKSGQEYKYQVRGRTLTALHQVANQYAGVLMKAQLTVQPKSENVLIAKVQNAEYAKINEQLPAGWGTPIPNNKLSYHQLPVSSKPFEIKLKNGIVDELIVSKNIPTWEVNMLKGIASQLQVDTQAENLISSRINNKPSHGSVNGVYKTMEDSITGECEVMYDISPLPQYQLQSRPELAPMPQLRGDGQLIDIVKTKNFSHCEQRPGYHFGLTALSNAEPAAAKMGEFMARSSVSRVVLTGSLQRYTIQSSVTTNKVILSPVLYDNQKGMVVSRMNLTLESVHSASGSPQGPAEPRKIKDLVYDYNDPFSTTNNAGLNDDGHYKKQQKRSFSDADDSSSSSSSSDSSDSSSDSSDSSSSSSSSSSDSNESQEQNRRMQSNAAKRFRRSLKNQQDSDSDSQSQENQKKNQQHKNQQQQHGRRNNESDSDSDDSSSDDSQSNESKWGKNRRARSNRRSNEKNNDSSDSDSSSSSSDSVSSSEEWFQPKPAMRKAPQHPMLPFFVGYQGSNIAASSQVNLAQAAKKIAQQIGEELQRPSQIPEKATLAKFTILARLVRVMDTKDMEQVARELYEQAKPQNAKSATHSESASAKISAWKAYRDAVAQAGTNPALLMIESWIEKGYVKGEEAAELLAVLPETARTPTREYMDTFFKLMKKSEIQKQQFLNVSAVIAFTDLARRAQVDNATAHDRYPTHVYGRLNPKKASAVTRDYIPYLAQQLKSAVQEGDSHKVQVYTRALGNIAHPKILAVFEPFLEGQKPVSTFQRLHMVVALNKLAKISPKVARPVLFRVYQNAGEAAEIRSAAVFMLMKTNPPASMLQRMAEFTNQDPSKQVRSVVKSAIESAANRLWSQDQQELAENARAAVDMLNATLNGAQYSKVLLKSDDVEEMSLAYKAALATIGSDDSYIPSAAFVSARANLGGFQANYLRAGAMASSVSDLIDLLAEQFQQQGSRSHKSGKRSGRSGHSDDFSASGSWSADKIANMLNIQPDQAEQVEANFLINVLAQQRFFTLDNHTVEQIPHYLEKAANTLRSGENFNYTKLYNRYALTMGFPTEMGLPLVYTLKAPTLVKVGGEARVRTQPDIANGPKDSVQIPNAVNASADIHFTYSTRTEAKLGFVTPFDHQRYIAGLDKDVLVNLPIRANMDLDLENAEVRVKLQPIKAEKDFKIVQISAQPYTAQHDILNLSPVPEQKPIKLRKEPQQANFTVGQDMTGMAFRIDAATEGDFADFAAMYNQAKNYDGISALLFPTAEQTIKAYELSVSYDHQKTSAKSVTLTASYDNDADEDNYSAAGNDSQEKHAKKSKRSNKNNNDDDSSDYDNEDFSAEQGNNGQNAANPSNASPNSQSRQQQFLRRAAAGIKSANTSVIDLSAQFNGEHKAQFIATAAYANSQVDEKARVLVYLRKVPARSNSDNKEQQLAMTATAKMPNVPYMDFQKALNADPKSQIQAQIVFGEKLDSSASKITIQAQMKQTNARKEFVSRQPMSALCQEQMQRGNKFLPACQNATIEANIMDLYTADIHFDKLSQRVKNCTYKAYAAARYFGWQYNYENFVNPKNSHNNKVELQLRFAPNLKSANLSIDAPAMSAEFNNVRLNPWVARAAAIHPMHSQVELIAKKALGGGFPMCVVDQSAANTFDNKTYPLNLGNNWHVMMQSVPKDTQDNQDNQQDDATDKVSVLVRDAGSHDKKELKVILDEDVVEFTPSSGSFPNIKINGHSVSINSGKTAKLIGRSGSLLAEVYPLPANTIKFYAWEQKMEVVYDGARVALIVGQTYRGEIRGLCGTFDSNKATDFKTPRNCVLKNPQQFAATWAINPSGAVKEQQQKAEQAACFPERVLYGDVISDREAGRYHQQQQQKQSGSRRTRNSGKASRYNNDSNDSNSSSSSSSNSDESNSREQQQSGKQSACTQHRVKVIQEHGKTCFSLRPLPQCGSSCKPTNKVEKNVDFHCTYNHPAASHWVEMIKKGANPDFSQKGANHQQMVSMPESCRAH